MVKTSANIVSATLTGPTTQLPEEEPSHNGSKDPNSRCGRCVHNHSVKDCLCNLKNPKRVLGKLAARTGNNADSESKKQKTSHNHNVEVVKVDEDNNEEVGFMSETSEGKHAATDEFTEPPFTDVTDQNNHCLDCFSIQDVAPVHETATPPLTASRDTRSASGLHCTSLTPTISKTSGSGLNKSDVETASGLRAKEKEELQALDGIANAVSMALFDEEDTHVTEISNDNIGDENDKPTPGVIGISQHEITQGDDTPMTIVNIQKIQGMEFKKPLRALIDTGSKCSFIHKSASPVGCAPTKAPGMTTTPPDRKTLIDKRVRLDDIILPELNTTAHMTKPHKLCVAEATAAAFNMILGQDVNLSLGINVVNSKRVITWMGNEVPLRKVNYSTKRFQEMQQQCMSNFSPEEDEIEPSYCNVAETLAAKLDSANACAAQ